MSKYVKQRGRWYLVTGSKGQDGIEWGLDKWGCMVAMGRDLEYVESESWPLTKLELEEVKRRNEQIRVEAARSALPVAGFNLTVGEVETIIERLLYIDRDYECEVDAECSTIAEKLRVLLP